MTHNPLNDQQLDEIKRAVAASFDQHETAEDRQARWENAALAAGRTIDRNALAVYLAVADAEQNALAADWAHSVASTDAAIRRLRAEVSDLADEKAKLIRWRREDGDYEQRLREQHDLDVAELNRLRARVWELERPAVEAKRNEIRDSYAELIATAEETKDYEGAFDVQCRLREREEQWAREDAARPAVRPAVETGA